MTAALYGAAVAAMAAGALPAVAVAARVPPAGTRRPSLTRTLRTIR